MSDGRPARASGDSGCLGCLAVLLLLPGGCFVFAGVARRPQHLVENPFGFVASGAGFLIVSGLLFWTVSRRGGGNLSGAASGDPLSRDK